MARGGRPSLGAWLWPRLAHALMVVFLLYDAGLTVRLALRQEWARAAVSLGATTGMVMVAAIVERLLRLLDTQIATATLQLHRAERDLAVATAQHAEAERALVTTIEALEGPAGGPTKRTH